MKTHRSLSQRRAVEFAKRLVDNAEVHSAMKRNGEVSHIVARMRRDDFCKVYPAWAHASVYIAGQWLLFEFSAESGTVLNRNLRSRLDFSVAEDPLSGRTSLRFHRLGKTVFRCSLRTVSSEPLWNQSDGLQVLAKASRTAFERTSSRTHLSDAFTDELPVIHVVPDRGDLEEDFDRRLVLLQ